MNATILLAVFLASILSMIVGSIWYAPPVFGNVWMKEVGLKKDKNMKNNMMNAMITSFICNMVTGYVLLLMPRAFSGNVGDMVTSVVVVWVGFVAAVRLSHFAFERKSFRLFWITSLHDLLTLLVMGLFFWVWF